MLGKDDISVWSTRHFMFLLLRTKGRLHATITIPKLIPSGEISHKQAWARFPSIGMEYWLALIDLAYLFAGLVAITQSRLVHRMPQGVEHTDPTEWSNSYRSIRDKFVLAVQRTANLFKDCSLFSFQRWFSHSHEDGSATFHIIKCTDSIQKWLSLCTHIMYCFANSLVTYRLYLNDINKT